ncbi:MAG TPA: DUF488 domain-containing protein [Solirubrobacteraceae bacterium]|nr:DUF488 domain-containing protein [Solirubrobacteraceae bacterium]
MDQRLAIWTVGHSNHELERFVELVTGAQIEVLVDVRSYPYSRYAPHFNREEIATTIAPRGIRYVFMGDELGGRPSRDEHYDGYGHALYGPMSEEPGFRAAIDRLLDGASGRRLVLMCSEGDPHDCHRRLLVGRVLAERGVELRHILPSGGVVVERSVELGEESCQCSLFGEEAPWRSTQSVSRRRRLSASSHG